MIGTMLAKYMAIPAGILAVAIIYWLVSHDPAGAVLLLIFAVAMTVMGAVLVPTFGDAGPTAPIDPDWPESPKA